MILKTKSDLMLELLGHTFFKPLTTICLLSALNFKDAAILFLHVFDRNISYICTTTCLKSFCLEC